DIEDDQIETMLRVIDRECNKYGAAIVTGHTGRYEGCSYPMVGGATFLAIAPNAGWVTANMARPGNRLLVTKTAALEATAILSNTFPELVERDVGSEVTKHARALFESMGTVDDARAAEAAEGAVAKLKRKGIPATDIGAFSKKGRPCLDRGHPFRPADRDPFWIAFSRALAGEIA